MAHRFSWFVGPRSGLCRASTGRVTDQPVHQLHWIEPSVRAPYDGPSFFVVRRAAKRPLEFVHFSGRSGGVDGAISRIQTEVGNQFGVFGNFFA